MKKRLQEKVALVFGGNGDIGGAIAKGFCREGAIVIPTGRNSIRNKKMIAELKKMGNRWNTNICCDVTKDTEIAHICRAIIRAHKKIDVMVFASGLYLNKPAETVTKKEWNHIIDTNLSGAFRCAQVVGTAMLRQGSGSIINIGSLSSYVALTGTIAYSVSKAGIMALSNGLSAEWSQRGVRVNTLIPGVFPTRLNQKALKKPGRVSNILKGIPMKRLGKVEELVGAAVFLASDESQYVSGISLPVDGGFLSFSGY